MDVIKTTPGQGGAMYLPKPCWQDVSFPFVSKNLDVSGGHIDYNYTDCTVDFDNTSAYPEDVICFVAQMPHGKKLNSSVCIHFKWHQEEDSIPNVLLAYRWYCAGREPEEFILTPVAKCVYEYEPGGVLQMCCFGLVDAPTDEIISSNLDIKLYRDTTNVSGLFAGADPYTLDLKLKEASVHYLMDSIGSDFEYAKS